MGMSILLAMGVLAFAIQASGETPELQTDTQASLNACISVAPPEDADMDSVDWKPFIGCIFQQTAAQMDTQLPIKIDDTTTLVAVSATGPQFNYTYVADMLVGDLAPGSAASIERATRQTVCQSPDMVATMKRGGSYFYRWLDRSGAVIHTALVARC